MARFSVDVDKRGLKRLLRRVRKVPSMRVGILGSDGSAPRSGTTNAQIAAYHELGAGVPRRSWLRDWVSESLPLVKRELLKASRDMAANGGEQALGKAGARFVGEIQKRISRRIPPPLAAETIAAKGSAVPLIDTDQLRASMTWDLEDG